MKSKEKEDILYTETRVVQGKTTTLEYLLTRKAVKNINIRIKSDKRILVSASKTVPASVIDRLILEKERMIINALKKYEGLSNEQGKESNSYEEGDGCCSKIEEHKNQDEDEEVRSIGYEASHGVYDGTHEDRWDNP